MTKPWWTRALLGRTSVSNPLQAPGLDEAPDAQFEMQWRPLVKQRLFAILACLGLWVVAIEGRLFWIQVIDHDYWANKARTQQEDTEPIYLPRGSVLDRNGRLMAFSVNSFDVHLNPRKAADAKYDPARLAHDICAAFGDCDADEEASILARLQKPKTKNVVIRRAREMSFQRITDVLENQFR